MTINRNNVTEFITKHPGGTKPFEKYSGTDATEKFQKISNHLNSYGIASIMKSLRVGKLA